MYRSLSLKFFNLLWFRAPRKVLARLTSHMLLCRQRQATDHLPRSVLEQLKLVIFLGGTNCARQHASFWASFLFFMKYSFSWVREHWQSKMKDWTVCTAIIPPRPVRSGWRSSNKNTKQLKRRKPWEQGKSTKICENFYKSMAWFCSWRRTEGLCKSQFHVL